MPTIAEIAKQQALKKVVQACADRTGHSLPEAAEDINRVLIDMREARIVIIFPTCTEEK